MNRRRFLMGAGASLACGPALARLPVRVVALLPLTGEHAALGRMLHGIALVAAEAVNRGKLAGHRALVVQVEDWRSDPRHFAALTHRFATGEGRPAGLFGPCPDGSRAELGEFLDQVNGVLWDPAGYEGAECSGGILHGGPTPHQSLTQLLPFMAQEVGRRFLLVGGGGAYSRTLDRVAAWALDRMDATVIGRADTPADRVSWLAKLRRERVDVVFCSLQGRALVEFLAAYGAAGLDPREIPIASPTMTELEAGAAGPGVAEGHVACQPYFCGWKTLGNDRFLADLRRRLGRGFIPNAMAEALWGQLHLFAGAVAALNDVDPHPLLVREAARGREILLPQGRVRVEADTLHPLLWPKIAVAEHDGAFKVIARARDAIRPLPFWGASGGLCPAPILDPV